MKNLVKQQFQDYSEIKFFNSIGFMAETLGYNPVYFKVLQPKMIETEKGFEMTGQYMHYIHLYKNKEMKISIYYDKYNLGAMFPEQPYFELYDMNDVERFLDIEECRFNLLERLKDLIK